MFCCFSFSFGARFCCYFGVVTFPHANSALRPTRGFVDSSTGVCVRALVFRLLNRQGSPFGLHLAPPALLKGKEERNFKLSGRQYEVAFSPLQTQAGPRGIFIQYIFIFIFPSEKILRPTIVDVLLS